MSASSEITQLLRRWSSGDRQALERLMPQVYGELQRLAAARLRREPGNPTLDTLSLVHEAYLRLVDQRRVNWHNRSQFYALASRMMRRILVDHARRRLYLKRGGGARLLSLDEAPPLGARRAPELVALDDALASLARVDPELVHLVELRYFGGFTTDEVGAMMGWSSRTVDRRWRLARAWLYDHLKTPRSAR